MAHAQKPDFVFQRNGQVRLNQCGPQFSRLLAAEVCASAVVMLDTPCSKVVWRVLATHKGPALSPRCIRDVRSRTLDILTHSLTGYPLHSPVSPSFALPCITVCHHISTVLYLPSKLHGNTSHIFLSTTTKTSNLTKTKSFSFHQQRSEMNPYSITAVHQPPVASHWMNTSSSYMSTRNAKNSRVTVSLFSEAELQT